MRNTAPSAADGAAPSTSGTRSAFLPARRRAVARTALYLTSGAAVLSLLRLPPDTLTLLCLIVLTVADTVLCTVALYYYTDTYAQYFNQGTGAVYIL